MWELALVECLVSMGLVLDGNDPLLLCGSSDFISVDRIAVVSHSGAIDLILGGGGGGSDDIKSQLSW